MRGAGCALQVFHDAQKTWTKKRKHPTGIPLCPKSLDSNDERKI